MVLLDSNLSSQISKGNLVICSIPQGPNIGVVVELVSSNPVVQVCGELIGIPSTSEIEAFQNKLKREAALLQLCRDYLDELQFYGIILVDVETNTNESINVYCHNM